MRDYIKRRRDERAYDDFLNRKVAVARASVTADKGRSHEEVEAAFAARRGAIDEA